MKAGFKSTSKELRPSTYATPGIREKNLSNNWSKESIVQELCLPKTFGNYYQKHTSSSTSNITTKPTRSLLRQSLSNSIFDSYKNKCKQVEEMHALNKSAVQSYNSTIELTHSSSKLRPLSSIVDFTEEIPKKKRGYKKRRRKLSPIGKLVQSESSTNKIDLENNELTSSSSNEELSFLKPVASDLGDKNNHGESSEDDSMEDNEYFESSDDEVSEAKFQILKEMKDKEEFSVTKSLLLPKNDTVLPTIISQPVDINSNKLTPKSSKPRQKSPSQVQTNKLKRKTERNEKLTRQTHAVKEIIKKKNSIIDAQPVGVNFNELTTMPTRPLKPCQNCAFQAKKLNKQTERIEKITRQTLTVKEIIKKKNLIIDTLNEKCQNLLREYSRYMEQQKLLRLKEQVIRDEIEKTKSASTKDLTQILEIEPDKIPNSEVSSNNKELPNSRPPTHEQYNTLLEAENQAHKLEKELMAILSEKAEMTELLNNVLYTLYAKGYESIHNTNTGKQLELNLNISGKLLELKGRDIIRLKTINGPSNNARKMQIQESFLKNIIGVREQTIQELFNTMKQNEMAYKKNNKGKKAPRKVIKSKLGNNPGIKGKKSIVNPKDGAIKIENELIKFANCLEDICLRNPKTINALIAAQSATKTKYPVVDAVLNSIKSQTKTAYENSSGTLQKKSSRSSISQGQTKHSLGTRTSQGSINEKRRPISSSGSVSKLKKYSLSDQRDTNGQEPELIEIPTGKKMEIGHIIAKPKLLSFIRDLHLPELK